MRSSSTRPSSIAAAARPAPPIETSLSSAQIAAELACLRDVETKPHLARGRPPERALAVGDKAVHRDAHRVDQHGFNLIPPKRRTTIAMTFTIEPDIRLS